MTREQEVLAQMISYLTPNRYVSGRIVEYDIKSANVTMLSKYKTISDDYRDYLLRLPKQQREVDVGLLIKSDKKYYDTINLGIIEAKKLLISTNNIDPNNIIRIANDAIYVNSSYDLQYTQFDEVLFVKKSVSSSMLNLNKIIIFLSILKDDLNITVKGINETNQTFHQKYFMTFLANILFLLQRGTKEDVFSVFNSFYKDYIQMKLPVEYYREFNSSSLYKVKNSPFYVSNNIDISNVDIDYNLYLLRELWSILLENRK